MKSLPLLLLCTFELFPLTACRKQNDSTSVRLDQDTVSSPDLDKQCPCLKPKGSSKCLPYQTRNVAATLEEAMTTFPDPKAQDNEKSLLISNCNDPGCRSCNYLKLKSFEQTISRQNRSSPLLQELQPLYSKYGISLDFITNSIDKLKAECRIYELRTTPAGVTIQIPGDIEKLNVNHRDNKSKENSRDNRNRNNSQTKLEPSPTVSLPPISVKSHSRKTRETSPNVQYYNIDCRSRGDPVEDGSVWCGLCDTCWQWAVLSSDYFPSYINILNCGTTTRCLSGYGQCLTRTRGLTLLHNYGTSSAPNWKEYSFVSPTSCDCQVRQNSALARFIRD